MFVGSRVSRSLRTSVFVRASVSTRLQQLRFRLPTDVAEPQGGTCSFGPAGRSSILRIHAIHFTSTRELVVHESGQMKGWPSQRSSDDES
eukprot:5229070-Prymnesium_polylepis.1